MKITKTKLKHIIKEELDSAMGQKVYLVTVGYGSTAVGIFSSREAAEKAVLEDIEAEHQEQARRSRADEAIQHVLRTGGAWPEMSADTTAKLEDYNIDEYTLNKGRG
jgi:precorrin-6B methylase 2